jgi:hypothetical protein
MDPLILAPWRNLALIYLMLPMIIVAVGPIIGLFFAIRGVRALKRVIRAPLKQSQMWAMRIQQGTSRTTNAIVDVPIRISSNATRARVTAWGVWDYVLER